MVAVGVGVAVAVMVAVGVGVVVALAVVVGVVVALAVAVGVTVALAVAVGVTVVVVVAVGVKSPLFARKINLFNGENEMKRICEQVDGEGLESLLGEHIQVWCVNYIYSGILIGVNAMDIKLKDCHVVYETGPLSVSGFKDSQKIASQYYIRTAAIESYGKVTDYDD